MKEEFVITSFPFLLVFFLLGFGIVYLYTFCFFKKIAIQYNKHG